LPRCWIRDVAAFQTVEEDCHPKGIAGVAVEVHEVRREPSDAGVRLGGDAWERSAALVVLPRHLLGCVGFVLHEAGCVVDQQPRGAGLTTIDHLTHNVHRGRMDEWAGFYERLFNFREIRYFDIEGKVTGLFSKAMTSPCGQIRIPLNESQDDKSQIEEFLREYKGEGIQHIALGTSDIYQAVDIIRERGIGFQDTPDTYYEMLPERIIGHEESIPELEKRGILMDGAPTEGQGLLLQIFTRNVIGPIFFEIIQRKGNEGFGEGNFKALFESIELDQMRRGVI
jgi:4-hydroxyphenylpyruvate dioxygenase